MTEHATEPVEPPEGDEPRTYTQEEWDALKDESIRNRKKAKDVDSLREALQNAYLKEGTAGVLVDASDLAWSEDFNDPETGLPDVARIKDAAEALAEAKPHLARVRGDVGQGFRGEDIDAVDLAGMLRAGA